MERKIGEIFEYGSRQLQVKEYGEYREYYGCCKCYFYSNGCLFSKRVRGCCAKMERKDGKDVYFKQVRK